MYYFEIKIIFGYNNKKVIYIKEEKNITHDLEKNVHNYLLVNKIINEDDLNGYIDVFEISEEDYYNFTKNT